MKSEAKVIEDRLREARAFDRAKDAQETCLTIGRFVGSSIIIALLPAFMAVGMVHGVLMGGWKGVSMWWQCLNDMWREQSKE